MTGSSFGERDAPETGTDLLVVTFPPMGSFEPLMSLEIEPKTKADQENLGNSEGCVGRSPQGSSGLSALR